MKKLIISCVMVGVFVAIALAQPPSVEWSRVYGGTGFESMWAVVPTPGGRYLVAGQNSSYGDPNSDFWVILLDAAGDTVWTRLYGGPNFDFCSYAIATSDGGFALVGMRDWVTSDADSSIDGWLIKLNANGDSLWSREFGSPTTADWPYWVEQTGDGGFIVGGTLYPGSAGSWDGWLVKFDAGGAVQWQQTYGGAGVDEFISVTLADDGGYVATGSTNSFGANAYDGWAMKANASGNVVWNQLYGTAMDEALITLSRSNDGGFLMVGYVNEPTPIYSDWYLVKTNSLGTPIWQRQYGSVNAEDSPWEAEQTADGGYIVGGYFEYPDSNGVDMVGLKLDANGDSTWSFRYGGDGPDYGWFAYTTPDGGYILGADTYSSWTHGDADWLIVKTQTECDDPTPLAPQVVITTGNSNAYLHWDPVTESVSGCPIFATHYLVFYSPTSPGPYYYHGYTTGTTYTHLGVLAYAPGQFYNVVASTAPLPTLRELPDDGTLTEDAALSLLQSHGYETQPVVVNISHEPNQISERRQEQPRRPDARRMLRQR